MGSNVTRTTVFRIYGGPDWSTSLLAVATLALLDGRSRRGPLAGPEVPTLPAPNFNPNPNPQVVKVVYNDKDPAVLPSVLQAFWGGHNAFMPQSMTRNESTIFYTGIDQQIVAEAAFAQLAEGSEREVQTKLRPASVLWPAGPSHHLAHYVGKAF
jgi:hypothetical protein